MGRFKESLMESETFDLIYKPIKDDWYNEESIQMEIKDIRLSKNP
jgi:hypothetical protein